MPGKIGGNIDAEYYASLSVILFFKKMECIYILNV